MKVCSVEGCGEKYKSNGLCNKHNTRKWYKDNSERHNANAKKWREKNSELDKANHKRWREENSERHNANAKKWREKNLEYKKKWIADNPEKVAAHLKKCIQRREERMNALPWATQYAEEIKLFYANTPPGMTIDHILPLLGDKYGICGLHLPWNLRYLPIEENRKKGNRPEVKKAA